MSDAAKLVQFVDMEGEGIFSAGVEMLPRPGDVVCYSMEARDQEKWAPEAWAENKAISGKEWRVERVSHEFRRFRVDSPNAHVIFVHVTPYTAEAPQ